MDFKHYFMGLTVTDRDIFAGRCQSSRAHMQNIAYGLKPCGENLAINIERESGGLVRCETLRPDVDWAYIRATDCYQKKHSPLAGRVKPATPCTASTAD